VIVVTVARKPLGSTVASSILERGTGALNIDGCRIEVEGGSPSIKRRLGGAPVTYNTPLWKPITSRETYCDPRPGEEIGRWPANLILSPKIVDAFDAQSGDCPSTMTGRADPGFAVSHPGTKKTSGMFGGIGGAIGVVYADSGGACRFFKVLDED
jgi:hypothetical protein